MEKLDRNAIFDLLRNEEWIQLSDYLVRYIITPDKAGSLELMLLPEDVVTVLDPLLEALSTKLENNYQVLSAITITFRVLRNLVSLNTEAQGLLTLNIYQSTYAILNKLVNSNSPCLPIMLQFLINSVVKNPLNAHKAFDIFKPALTRLLVDSEYKYYASALIYNILYLNRKLIEECADIFSCILENVTEQSGSEYDEFLTELFVQNVHFMNLYETFSPSHRLTILSVLLDLHSKENLAINTNIINNLTLALRNKSDCILRTTTSEVETLEPREVVFLLEFLSSLSGLDDYRPYLQTQTDLIIKCACLLNGVHSLGKASQNDFTPIQKLSELDELARNPMFGFKADLIRFLGNVCWKHRENQDKLRELECIPVLLECCNIDAQNPFIMQWSILAIRNLCEANEANQEIIAGLTKQGVVSSSVLFEMGLTLHDDGSNKIILGPLPSDN